MKKALNHYKNNGRNFQYTKFSVIDFVLTDRVSLSGTRPKSACGKSFSNRLSFSAVRNVITKATKNITFGFFFSYLVFFRFLKSLNVIVCKRYGFDEIVGVEVK